VKKYIKNLIKYTRITKKIKNKKPFKK